VVLRLRRQPASHRSRHPAPARNQHYRGHRRHQAAPADFQIGAASLRQHEHFLRSVGNHSRVLSRRRVYDGADAGPGRDGDFSLHPQLIRYHDPEPGAAFLHHRDLCRHVSAPLQPRQPLHDGADSLHRFRRGRCDRHARKHLPAHGDGGEAASGRLGRFPRDRIHDCVDDSLAGGRVYPRAVHGRGPRPVVQGICGDYLRGHSDLGRRLGHADADALQPVPSVPGGAAQVPILPGNGAVL